MTYNEDEFRKKWAHVIENSSNERLEELAGVALDQIIGAVESIEFLTVVETAPEGVTDEEAKFVHDVITHEATLEDIRDALR